MATHKTNKRSFRTHTQTVCRKVFGQPSRSVGRCIISTIKAHKCAISTITSTSEWHKEAHFSQLQLQLPRPLLTKFHPTIPLQSGENFNPFYIQMRQSRQGGGGRGLLGCSSVMWEAQEIIYKPHNRFA